MSRRRHIKQPLVPREKEPKFRVEIVVAIIGLLGTITAAVLASPLIEKWIDRRTVPSVTQDSDGQVPIPAPGINEFRDQTGVEMILVPEGEFTMGSDMDDNEKPPHKVYLDEFYIDKYEATNLQYKVCVDSGNCQLPKDIRNYDDTNYANHPVVYVDWQMAQAYCEWRGANLPTEAQWEKAARGTDGRTYPWGEVASCEQANYGYCIDSTTEVGRYKSGISPYGIYDMAGNVWEWVADWYLSDYYQIIGSDSSNPVGPATGDGRSIRGGDWTNDAVYIRSANRSYSNSFEDYIGFRCARSTAGISISSPASNSTPTVETQHLPDNVTDVMGVQMVLVPAGEFVMGTDNANANSEEKPAHTVYLNSFYIDKYEVTNALYKICVDMHICDLPVETSSYTRDSYFGNSEFDNYPVIYIDWNAAKTYCEWRGAHLPTEAEWEKAARGTDGRTYPWGEEIDKKFANYGQNIGDTTAVGIYESGNSPYGAYDMIGNVWEWVADWYSADYYKTLPLISPLGPELGKFRGLRGGSWFVAPTFVETFTRGGAEPTNTSSDYGFRCARDANP